MTCDHALELVEPVAAGDAELSAAARAHFESCPRCASALASARRIEAALAGPAPQAPAQFTQAVVYRIRRERWRSEQQVDRMFNVAVAAAVVLVVGGGAALMNVAVVMAAVASGWAMISGLSGTVLRDAAPTVNTYVAAVGLLVSALATWWWADRTMTM